MSSSNPSVAIRTPRIRTIHFNAVLIRPPRGPACRNARGHYPTMLPMIRLLVTGGTFDKEYDEIGGTLFFKDTHVEEMLRLGRSRLDVAVETVMLIDSLQMTAAERARVAERCRECAETQIVVTHGTDTMVETAAALAGAVSGKTIVLTGAMIPYA